MGSWPVDYQEQRSGLNCILCSEGRPEESGHRIRFYTSETADAYLHTHGIQCGYCVVIWRGRHVAGFVFLTSWLLAMRSRWWCGQGRGSRHL